MATFYCIHGAAFNGDGTSTAEATVGGGVGAFNDAVACLDGTEPVLTVSAKPYTVIFKTNHLGVDVTLIYSASTTIAYGVGHANRLTYIFDDGTYWVGEGGVFTMQFNAGYLTSVSGSTTTLLNACADLIGMSDYNFVIGINYNTSGSTYFKMHDGVVVNMYLKQLTPSSTSQKRFVLTNSKYSQTHLMHCKRDVIEVGGTNYIQQITTGSTTAPTKMNIDGLVLNFRHDAINTSRSILLDSRLGGDYGLIRNISFIGDAPQNPWSIGCIVDGIALPPTSDITLADHTRIKNIGAIDSYDFKYTRNGVVSSWKNGELWPTYSALLPDNTTNWCVKVDTSNFIEGDTAPVYELVKTYTEVAAIKTLSIQVLIPVSFINPTNLDWWATFSYENVDGSFQTFTTCGIKLIAASSASWSATSYASITYNAYEFKYTTPTNIKQNSVISVGLYTNRSVITANEYYFIDPNIEVV